MRWLVYAVVRHRAPAGRVVLLGSPVPGLLALPLVPVAAGAAILKYRLYDIDPVINKTIVSARWCSWSPRATSHVVLGIGTLVPAGHGVLWLITTALVAVVFEPLRRRAQRLADRVVYGHRTTPTRPWPGSRLDRPRRGGLLDGVAPPWPMRSVRGRWWCGSVTASGYVPRAAWPAAARSTTRPLPRALYRAAWRSGRCGHEGAPAARSTLRKPAGESLTGGERGC